MSTYLEICQALSNRKDILEAICIQAHDNYERSAIEHGWLTQKASRVHWPDVPESNKRTMRGALKPLTDQIIDDMIQVVIRHHYTCDEPWPCHDVNLIIARLQGWGVLADRN